MGRTKRMERTDGYGASSEHYESARTSRTLPNNPIRQMLNDADSIPENELLECIRSYQLDKRDLASRERAIRSNLRLVRNIARKNLGRFHDLDVDDLTNEGVIGLMNAIETFDPRKGPFHPYAARLIRQAVKRAIVYEGMLIRRSMGQYTLYGKILRFRRAFLNEHGISPTIDEIAREIGMPPETVRDCIAAKESSSVISHNVIRRESGYEFTIEAREPSLTPYQAILAKDELRAQHALRERYLATLETLEISDRDREVFGRKLRLNGYPPDHSNDDIGRVVGLSASRVQQIAARVARTLGFTIAEWKDKDWLSISTLNAERLEGVVA